MSGFYSMCCCFVVGSAAYFGAPVFFLFYCLRGVALLKGFNTFSSVKCVFCGVGAGSRHQLFLLSAITKGSLLDVAAMISAASCGSWTSNIPGVCWGIYCCLPYQTVLLTLLKKENCCCRRAKFVFVAEFQM